MAVKLHFHSFPGCGTTHNTACSTIAGVETNCFQAEQGPNKGQWACFHVTGESISIREFTSIINELSGALSEQKKR